MLSEWKALRERFGHLRPDQVTAALCAQHAAARREAGIKDGTVWTELGRLRSAFKRAAGAKLIPDGPLVLRPPKPAPKDRWLIREEIARLPAVPMAGHIRLAILLMLGTASTLSETRSICAGTRMAPGRAGPSFRSTLGSAPR